MSWRKYDYIQPLPDPKTVGNKNKTSMKYSNGKNETPSGKNLKGYTLLSKMEPITPPPYFIHPPWNIFLKEGPPHLSSTPTPHSSIPCIQ